MSVNIVLDRWFTGGRLQSPMTSPAAKGRGFESIGPEDQERRDNFSLLQTRLADSQSYFRGDATPVSVTVTPPLQTSAGGRPISTALVWISKESTNKGVN